LRIAAFPSFDGAKTVLNWRQNSTSGRQDMHKITVRLPADGFPTAMSTVREWLDRNRYQRTRFKSVFAQIS